MSLGLVRINQRLFNEDRATILCFDNIQEDPTWLQEFADAMRDTIAGTWDNYCINDWSAENLTISFLSDTAVRYSVDVDFTDGNVVGNILTEGLPPQTNLLVSTSYVGDRPNRGRIYFCGLGEVNQNNGIFATQMAFDFAEMVRGWRDGFNIQGINASLQILRRKSDKFPQYVANPVQFATGDTISRTQRRRQRGSTS